MSTKLQMPLPHLHFSTTGAWHKWGPNRCKGQRIPHDEFEASHSQRKAICLHPQIIWHISTCREVQQWLCSLWLLQQHNILSSLQVWLGGHQEGQFFQMPCLQYCILRDPDLAVDVILVDFTHHIEIHISTLISQRPSPANICTQIRRKAFGAILKCFSQICSTAIICTCSSVCHYATFANSMLCCSKSSIFSPKAVRTEQAMLVWSPPSIKFFWRHQTHWVILVFCPCFDT